MKRKFLIISAMWDNEYFFDVIGGIKKRFANEEYLLHIFNAYDISYGEGLLKKEQEIYTLFNPDEYEGVFVVSNGIANLDVMSRALDEIRVRNIPIVCMGVELSNTIYVGVENYRALYRVVEHMIVEHSCKEFCYIGGPEENEEAKKRLQGYRAALKKYGFEYDENREVKLGYLYEDGIRAYEIFKERGLHLPDAIVCANDIMALGFCDRAGKDGYYAPDDFRITGFDDYYMAADYVPSITTVNMNWENMGYIGADRLLKTLEGTVVEKESYSNEIIKCNQSCGCVGLQKDYRKDALSKLRRSQLEHRITLNHRYVLQTMCSCADVNQMQQKLNEILNILGLEHICICINESILQSDFSSNKNGYDKEFVLCSEDEMERIDRTKQLIPTSWIDNDEMSVLMFSPLYFAKNTFGYVVIPYGQSLVYCTKKRALYENLSIAIEAIRQSAELNFMNRKLNDLYIHDGFTGLYNRFGYGKFARSFFNDNNGEIYAVFLDVNRLKTINDMYGHEMGDISIKGVADAIQATFSDGEICVRMGGDEFLVLGKCSDNINVEEMKQNINAFLKKINEDMNLPFEISVSVGYASNKEIKAESLDLLLGAADKKMYENKTLQ